MMKEDIKMRDTWTEVRSCTGNTLSPTPTREPEAYIHLYSIHRGQNYRDQAVF